MLIEICKGMLYLESVSGIFCEISWKILMKIQVGIVHRDLGARNLLVTESDGKLRVKVGIFIEISSSRDRLTY